MTGRPKNGPVFQLDQQCYPFLELCDFFETFSDGREFVRAILLEETVQEVLNLVMSKKSPGIGLLPTGETPGDDAVEHPYYFSSHVLLWYSLTRFVNLISSLAPNSATDIDILEKFVQDLRVCTLKYFLTTTTINTGKKKSTVVPILAYLTDGYGHETFYHDANDIPTLFATIWGFLQSKIEIEAWRNTMDYSLSPRNSNGYCNTGRFRGLGSVHTPGPWPLGYFQELVYARMMGNTLDEEDAWRRIQDSMHWDGTFCEAVDPLTGRCTSKHWFSWPGAMIAARLEIRSMPN